MRKHLFHCVEAHTCGNPVRLIKNGGPKLESKTMADKRLEFIQHYDWIRTGLMFEPRGHDLMSGSILYPPTDPTNDIGVLFIETSGCLPMCGHGLIGTVTIGIEEKLIKPRIPGQLKIETPAGLVKVSYTYSQTQNKVASVKFINVPSFLYLEALEVECPGLGRLCIDVSFGGNFYAIIDIQKNYKGLPHYSIDKLIVWSRHIREFLNRNHCFVHPLDSKINSLSHVLWTGTSNSKLATSRNAVFYGEKAIDRSPCGTGTSARMAQWYAKGKLEIGDNFVHQSIIDSLFIGRVESETKIDSYSAIIPSIEGQARIIGYSTIIIDEEDPFFAGFQVI